MARLRHPFTSAPMGCRSILQRWNKSRARAIRPAGPTVASTENQESATALSRSSSAAVLCRCDPATRRAAGFRTGDRLSHRPGRGERGLGRQQGYRDRPGRLGGGKRSKDANEAIKYFRINSMIQKTKPNKATKSFGIVWPRKNEAKTKPLSPLDRGVD